MATPFPGFAARRCQCPPCLRFQSPAPPPGRARVHDRGLSSSRSAFVRAAKIAQAYETRLRSLARHVGDILRGHDVSTPHGARLAEAALRQYERTLGPWAEAVAQRMLRETAARDERSWFRVAASMGRDLKREIQNAPTGRVMQRLQAEQVTLIRSIPLEAAERVQALAQEALSGVMRAESLAQRIMEGEGVSRGKAALIARTETGRASTVLTQARAEHVGSTHYIWRTAGDGDVRASHKALNGKAIAWSEPPECDPGHRAHAGAIFNCRCYPEPIIPD